VGGAIYYGTGIDGNGGCGGAGTVPTGRVSTGCFYGCFWWFRRRVPLVGTAFGASGTVLYTTGGNTSRVVEGLRVHAWSASWSHTDHRKKPSTNASTLVRPSWRRDSLAAPRGNSGPSQKDGRGDQVEGAENRKIGGETGKTNSSFQQGPGVWLKVEGTLFTHAGSVHSLCVASSMHVKNTSRSVCSDPYPPGPIRGGGSNPGRSVRGKGTKESLSR